MSTRHRIEFNEKGQCNACIWSEEKSSSVDWNSRINELEKLLDLHRSNDGSFDCLVPCSGGKDGSYVAYKLKHDYGMNPLCLTLSVPLPDPLGDKNLQNFIDSGYDHIKVSPNPEIMRALNKIGFVKQGRPTFGWLTCLQTSIPRVAVNFNLPLIFYGEDGEVEYGGSTETKNQMYYTSEYARRVYLEGSYNDIESVKLDFPNDSFTWWTFPTDEELSKVHPKSIHWSYFENWDPYHHYLVAKEKCGLLERETASNATYNNFSQTDSIFYELHTYLMFLKFGFGRCTQDIGVDIRRGAMSRDQGVALVKLYDHLFPEKHLSAFLNYYEMTEVEFMNVIDFHANKDLLHKVDGRWIPKFFVK